MDQEKEGGDNEDEVRGRVSESVRERQRASESVMLACLSITSRTFRGSAYTAAYGARQRNEKE